MINTGMLEYYNIIKEAIIFLSLSTILKNELMHISAFSLCSSSSSLIWKSR